MNHRLQQITFHGQSIWLDFTKRSFVESGELRKLIVEEGVTGVTSNPSIFGEALSEGSEYDHAIQRAALHGLRAEEAYERIVIEDIQRVADELADVFEHTDGKDGYVSLEVSPHLAHDTEGTIEQAREFWARVDRPNLFIKVSGTAEGLPAITSLTAEGINVNITLLFDLERYRAVAAAYIKGLTDRVAAGLPVDRITSVASFFLSRIDLVVDPLLEEVARNTEQASEANSLRGKTAIACAKQAYQLYKEIHASESFQRMAAAGARPQRLLWASTATKNPKERDVRYVEALIGPDTINTLTRQTLVAFGDHGDPTPRLEEGLDEARQTLHLLKEVGVDLKGVGQQLENEGIKKFKQPFDHLLGELKRKLATASALFGSFLSPDGFKNTLDSTDKDSPPRETDKNPTVHSIQRH